MKVLLVDNYDSFTFNLFHALEMLGVETVVWRNDCIEWNKVDSFDKIILSPGPGLPSESKGMFELISKYKSSKPILGVCLGMQAIAEFFGCELVNQKNVKHGVQEVASIVSESVLLNEIKSPFQIGLYHSWAVECRSDSEFHVTSRSSSGVVMSIEHKFLPLFGVQFHPESIMTPDGLKILKNFIESKP